MKQILPLFFLILSFSSFSQEIFNKGSIIQKNGDTLQGYIGNIYDSKSIKFKIQSNTKKQELSPGKIKGFILDGNTYVSKYVFINDYKFNESFKEYPFVKSGLFLEKNESFTPRKDSVFVQQVLKGRINLYQLNSKSSGKGFYAEKGSMILELPPVFFEFKKDSSKGFGFFVQNGIYNRISNLKGTFTEQRTYLDSLRSLMIDDNDFYKAPIKADLEYNLKSLSTFIKEYNLNYPDEIIDVVVKRVKGKKYFGINLGSAHQTYMLGILRNDQLKSSRNAAFGLFLLSPFYGSNKNTSFKLGFQHYNFQTFVTRGGMKMQEVDNDVNGISFGLRYSTMRGYVRPYFGGSVFMMKQNEYPVEFPLTMEFGLLSPIKKISVFVGGELAPIVKSKHFGYQVFSINAGILF